MIPMRTVGFLMGAVLAALMVSCRGESGTVATGPSGFGGTSSGTGATITGRVTTSGLSGAPSGGVAAGRWAVAGVSTSATSGITVTIVGTSVAAAVDGGGQFTLSNVPPGNVQLKFSGSGVDATLTISGVTATDRIEISVTLNGNRAQLDSDRRSSSTNRVEVQGLITSIHIAARSLQVAGQTVLVPPATLIRHGSTILPLADLVVGDRVQVKGTRDGSTVTATEVKVERQGQRDDDDDDDDEGDDDDDDGDRSTRVEVAGTVAGLSGTCPALSFNLGSVAVQADARTEYRDACSRITAGARVEVKGNRQADGKVLATRVELDD